jgi:hypothetical protein
MFSLLVSAFTALCSSFRTRAALQLEILALRHQINVLRRSQRGRVHLRTADRLFWRWLMHLWSGWRCALAMVKPETVIAWHRKGFRRCIGLGRVDGVGRVDLKCLVKFETSSGR